MNTQQNLGSTNTTTTTAQEFGHLRVAPSGQGTIVAKFTKLSNAWKACTAAGDGFVMMKVPPVKKNGRNVSWKHVHVQGVGLVGHNAPVAMGGLFERSAHDTQTMTNVLKGLHDNDAFA